MLKLNESKNFRKKAETLIPGLAHTFSKAPSSYVDGVYPIYMKSGFGSHVIDVDDNDYIDYVLGLGPIILGYNYPSVNDAIISALKEGINFSMPHYREVNFAELLTKTFPSADMAKFTKTGSDSVTAAVRACRSLTGRDSIAYCGGGGVWHDWFISATSRNSGVPKFNRDLIHIFEYDNISSLEEIFEKNKNKIAAVCIEPIIFKPPTRKFIKQVEKLTHENDAILIFDEIVTGFRMSLGGAQEYYDIKPDMTCLGKAIANGMPLGAVIGKSEYMEVFSKIFYSTTYAGDILSIAAGEATINTIRNENVSKKIWYSGDRLKNQMKKIIEELDLPLNIIGLPHRFNITVNIDHDPFLIRSIINQECIENGILFGQGQILHTFSHSQNDYEKTIDVFRIAGEYLKKAIDSKNPKRFLRGEQMKPVLKFPI